MQGLAMQRLLLAMAERDGIDACDFEFVMVAGHFLARDENIFTFFEGVQVKPPEPSGQQICALCVPTERERDFTSQLLYNVCVQVPPEVLVI